MAGDLINGTTIVSTVTNNSNSFLSNAAPIAYLLVGIALAGLVVGMLARHFWKG